jgi:hypothetical protein
MPSLDDVYRKFGETAEAAQLLETQLGNLLLNVRATNAGLLSEQDPVLAREIVDTINRSTLGHLLKQLCPVISQEEGLEKLLSEALLARNRLNHSFYRQHNFRRNAEQGRAHMMEDLESIHEIILRAYKAMLALSGIDIETIDHTPPTKHLPL